MSALAAATTYADWLVGTLTDHAADEHTAAYRTRLATATPIPVTVVRHRCPHCGTTRARQDAS